MLYSVWQVRRFWPIIKKVRKVDLNTVHVDFAELLQLINLTLSWILCIFELEVLNRRISASYITELKLTRKKKKYVKY